MQRFVNEILRGLEFHCAYIDDILIASSSGEEQMHLRMLFEQLQTYGVVLNLAKCAFSRKEIEFLGYLMTGDETVAREQSASSGDRAKKL